MSYELVFRYTIRETSIDPSLSTTPLEVHTTSFGKLSVYPCCFDLLLLQPAFHLHCSLLTGWNLNFTEDPGIPFLQLWTALFLISFPLLESAHQL